MKQTTGATKGEAGRPKHEIVREGLTQSLRAGEFEVGRRLPGDKDLAARFGVSYMTARRAVNEMVEASLLERRIGDGTYVRQSSQERLSTTTLNLICTTYEGATTKAFLQLAASAAARRGWRAHVIRIHCDHDATALRALREGEPSLLLADEELFKGPLSKALQAARPRAVVLGWRLDEQGVPSVLADDARAVGLAWEHLRELGHRKIAFLCNHAGSANERVQIAAWNALAPRHQSDAARRAWLIQANTPQFQCASRYAYDAMRGWLKTHRGEVSALISVSDELTLGALCALRDAGVEVPRAMALVNLNDSAAMEFSNPRVTCVDVDLAGHVETALSMIDAALRGESLDSNLQLIEPRLIARESVARLTHSVSNGLCAAI